MSNTAYPVKVRRTGASTQGSPDRALGPGADDLEEEDYEELYNDPYGHPYGDDDPAPRGIAGSPARKASLAAALILLIAVLGAAFWLLSSTPESQAGGPLAVGLSVGNVAPNFELTDVRTNKPVQLASLRGKPVFINFWGTWCPPCRQEMPEMQALYNQYKDQLTIVGVSMAPRDNPDLVKSFVDQASYSWTFIHDPDFSVATTYQAYSIPSSFFIDKNGIIRARHIGAMNKTQMEAYLAQTQQAR